MHMHMHMHMLHTHAYATCTFMYVHVHALLLQALFYEQKALLESLESHTTTPGSPPYEGLVQVKDDLQSQIHSPLPTPSLSPTDGIAALEDEDSDAGGVHQLLRGEQRDSYYESYESEAELESDDAPWPSEATQYIKFPPPSPPSLPLGKLLEDEVSGASVLHVKRRTEGISRCIWHATLLCVVTSFLFLTFRRLG